MTAVLPAKGEGINIPPLTTVTVNLGERRAQGRETPEIWSTTPQATLTTVITPDGNQAARPQYDAWERTVSTTQGGLTQYGSADGAAGHVIRS